MNRYWMLVVLTVASVATTVRAQPRAAPIEEIRGELAALAERVGRLESENTALKQRNDSLERRIAELEPAPAAVPVAPSASLPAAVPDAAPAPASRPWYENYKVSGYLFGDAYAVLANHDHSIEDQAGFWVRRGYLTFDAKIAEEWSARLRFEINSPGDFETNAKLEPFVKDAYLAWKHAGQELNLGLASAPTFEFIEGFWGYRSIEKTPLDLYRMGSSRDLGIALKGGVNDGKLFYHVMLGNGSGDGSETNKGKKAMAGFGLRPSERLVTQLYADYEDRPGETDRGTLQASVGWKGARSRYGLQYSVQGREVEGGEDDEVAVASVFGVWQLTDAGSLIARFDRSFDGYPDAAKIPYLRIANDTAFDLAILAWEQKLMKKISLIPNLEYVTYHDTGGVPAPDDDLYGRLTLYFEF